MPQDKYRQLLMERGGNYSWEAMTNPDLKISDIEGLYREEELEIPYKAMRECCTNAFCHRLYHRPGSSVGIAIYDDRVEIENSGTFPPNITMEKLLSGHNSEPQNLSVWVIFRYTRKTMEYDPTATRQLPDSYPTNGKSVACNQGTSTFNQRDYGYAMTKGQKQFLGTLLVSCHKTEFGRTYLSG